MAHVVGLDALDGVGVHHAQRPMVGASAANACRCDEVCVVRKVFGIEHGVATFYHTVVVVVDVVDVQPCAQTVVG